VRGGADMGIRKSVRQDTLNIPTFLWQTTNDIRYFSAHYLGTSTTTGRSTTNYGR
jgi:hypothetical protein